MAAALGQVLAAAAVMASQSAAVTAASSTVTAYAAMANAKSARGETEEKPKEDWPEAYGTVLLDPPPLFSAARQHRPASQEHQAGSNKIVLQTVSTMSASVAVACTVAIHLVNYSTKKRGVLQHTVRMLLLFAYVSYIVTNAVASSTQLLDAPHL